ncbi:amidohydrolase family protein [Roseomonas terrae]|jgi:5-methylthioadenosine/S-adenosylhomocysteine deaminase|uniref:Amidohydrolase family protein n=1 Tax=Neoroseomonas terrae TaxID=424799 RepID=A0ABS5EGC1_9PROT|nr:amidohydrolase family protein [Neoroseomonas terrae]MBR0650076.1 amidohydrolase family protein [Neoroseomonas terrae]
METLIERAPAEHGWTRIVGGLVLARADAEPRRCDILVQDGRIVALPDPDEPRPEDKVAIRFDARDCILIPGLVNTHVHSSGNLVRSPSDRWNLELQLHIGGAFRGRPTPRQKYVSVLLGAIEMISRGCTACYDIFFEAPLPTAEGFAEVARAYRDIGMRAVIAPQLSDIPFQRVIPGLMDALPAETRARLAANPPKAGAEIMRALDSVLSAWPTGQDLVRFAVAPTIPMHCTDGFLRDCAAFARQHGIGLHTHLAESKVQAVVGREQYGATIVGHLLDLGILSEAFTAAHAVWIDDDEARMLGDHGCSVAHAPGANMRLGVGVARTRAMLDAGVTLGLATDSRVCNDNLNMFEAMRLASYASRIQGYDRGHWLSTREVLHAATQGGARVLGLGDSIGQLAPGFAADIVFLDRRSTNYVPLVDLVHQLVHAEDATAVRHVMIGGRLVYRDRDFPDLDIPALLEEAETASVAIRAETAPAIAREEALDEPVLSICGCFARRPLGFSRFVGGEFSCA